MNIRKILLSLLATFLCGLSSYAYQVGEYIFMPDVRLKTMSNNLLVNGDFTNGTSGWTNLVGGEININYWALSTGSGPDGANTMVSIQSTETADDAYLCQHVAVESSVYGYYVSFKVKSSESASSSTTVGKKNYIDVYFNTDGSNDKSGEGFKQVASSVKLNTEWQEYSFLYVNTEGYSGFMNIVLAQLSADSEVADFQAYQVSSVYDIRNLQRELTFSKSLLDVSDFTESRDELEMAISICEQMLANEIEVLDDPVTGSNMADELVSTTKSFLDANTYDLTANEISGGMFNAVAKWSQKTSNGDWRFTARDGKNRWFHGSNTDNVYHQYGGGYALNAGAAYIEKVLPAGRYFLSIGAKGYRLNGTGSKSTADYNYFLEGSKLFINNDSVDYGALDTRYAVRKFMIVTVEKDDTLRAGFWHPDVDNGKKTGGSITVYQPELRMIGANPDDVHDFIVNGKLGVQMKSLLANICIANDSVANDFPWGKAELQELIATSQATYDAAQSGNLTTELGTAEAAADSLSVLSSLLKKAISVYVDYNYPYLALKEAIAEAEIVLNDPANASADAGTRTAFINTINAARQLIENVSAERTDEVVASFEEALANLKTTQVEFGKTTASYANPLEMPVVDPFFNEYKNESWTEIKSGSGGWSKATSDDFEGGTRLTSWRGETGSAMNKITQVITLTAPGAYEFICQAYAYNENSGRDKGRDAATGIYFFAADSDNATDSIGAVQIHTYRTLDTKVGYGAKTPEWFVISFNKQDASEMKVEFGFDAVSYHNKLVNTYAYGGNHIRYYGDYAKYTDDVKATLTAACDAADSKVAVLSQDVDEVQALSTAAANAREAIVTGTTAEQSKWILMLQRANSNLDAVVTAVQGVFTSGQVKTDDTIYDLQGRRITSPAAKGVYISNGKKYIF